MNTSTLFPGKTIKAVSQLCPTWWKKLCGLHWGQLCTMLVAEAKRDEELKIWVRKCTQEGGNLTGESSSQIWPRQLKLILNTSGISAHSHNTLPTGQPIFQCLKTLLGKTDSFLWNFFLLQPLLVCTNVTESGYDFPSCSITVKQGSRSQRTRNRFAAIDLDCFTALRQTSGS